MSRFYQHDSLDEPSLRGHSSKSKNHSSKMPSHTSRASRGSLGKPASESFLTSSEFVPSKIRGRANRKQTESHDSDQSLLEMLNSTVACLKQKKMDLEALGCLEQSLWLKRRMFGVDNSVVHKALNEVMLSYNSVAMQYLAQGHFDQCLAMLRKAEAITAPGNFKRCQALQILTFNNIGCCYRKLGKLKSALKYLKEAAQIGSGSTHVKNLSITHLNLCAIHSQLGRHDLALEHAQAAIFHTQEELVSLEDDERGEDGERERDQSALVDALDGKTREEKIIALAVAYHNLAVELEFNGRGEASLQWYKKALQLVWKYRETNEALFESFKKIFFDAKKKQKTTNVRQNGIPTFSTAAGHASSGRRQATRPKSAHILSRYMQEADKADVSYSSNVASQCYKATKPSTAGQRYYGSPPRSSATNRSEKYQRPASATIRKRPVSAKPSTRSNNRDSAIGPRKTVEDTFQMHWKKLEKKYELNDVESSPTKVSNAERKSRRPQSAGGKAAATHHQKPTSGKQRQQNLQGQICFSGLDDDFVGNDEDYGVIVDDGDSEDGFDDNAGGLTSVSSNNQTERGSNNGSASKISNERARSGTNLLSGAGVRRHRRVLDDSRSLPSHTSDGDSDSDAEPSSRRPDVDSPSTSHTGYNGDDDADTDSELPFQRVGHMEYLRRMKKLAENIKDDLNGVGVHPVKTSPAKLAASLSKGSSYRRDRNNAATDECGSQVSTPRSATSKIRDRLEQARLESLGNLHEAYSEGITPDQTQAKSVDGHKTSDDTGIIVCEEFYEFDSETKARSAEKVLFRAAAACRLQAFFRGERCRTEVTNLKKIKLENSSAKRIQRQVRLYLRALTKQRYQEEMKHQVNLQKEEVEDMAACLIQHLYRRTMRRSHHSTEQDKGLQGICSSAPRRQSPTGDVPLGSIFTMDAGIKQNVLELGGHSEPHFLTTAATVPRNITRELHAPRRSSTVPSIFLSNFEVQEKLSGEIIEPSPSDSFTSGKDSRYGSTNATPPASTRDSEEECICKNAAATLIQASIKSYTVRRRVAKEQAGHLSRMYIERRHFDIALDHALALEQPFLEKLSAIKIQALVRGQQSRLLTECIKAGVHSAVITIQRSFRIHRQNTHRAVDDGVRSIAAQTIQQVFRDYEARKAALHQVAVDREILHVLQIAAVTIQKCWRQNVAARDQCFEEIEAATCIQALGRGHLTRKSLKSLTSSTSGSGLSKPPSAFSMSSSVDKLVEEEHPASEYKDSSLSINYSFLPRSIRELYAVSSECQQQSVNGRINVSEIAELGLTFADFLQELEDCTDILVGSSALDAMRVLVETSPESTKTLANVVKVAQVLDCRLMQGFWSETMEKSSVALLYAFRDVLDAH